MHWILDPLLYELVPIVLTSAYITSKSIFQVIKTQISNAGKKARLTKTQQKVKMPKPKRGVLLTLFACSFDELSIVGRTNVTDGNQIYVGEGGSEHSIDLFF